MHVQKIVSLSIYLVQTQYIYLDLMNENYIYIYIDIQNGLFNPEEGRRSKYFSLERHTQLLEKMS
jgi:hypothetical protein